MMPRYLVQLTNFLAPPASGRALGDRHRSAVGSRRPLRCPRGLERAPSAGRQEISLAMFRTPSFHQFTAPHEPSVLTATGKARACVRRPNRLRPSPPASSRDRFAQCRAAAMTIVPLKQRDRTTPIRRAWRADIGIYLPTPAPRYTGVRSRGRPRQHRRRVGRLRRRRINGSRVERDHAVVAVVLELA